jgi:hypothetical protein
MASLAAGTATAAAPVDPYGPRGQWTPIVQSTAAQKPLKLTPMQIKQAANLKPDKDDNRKAIAKLLKPEQLETLKRLSWKARGGYALFDPELSKKLKITREQKSRLKEASEVNEVEHRKMKDFLTRARFRSREAMQKYIDGYRDDADKRLLDVLTAKQKKQLAEIVGSRAVRLSGTSGFLDSLSQTGGRST